MEELRTTPLHTCHEQLGARLAPFGGWLMPIQYAGIVAEHQATRTAAAMFDTCHMGRFVVRGPRSLDALSKIITADLRTMQDGQCRYGFLLREDGGVLDDIIAYRFRADHWLLVVNAGTQAADFAWIAGRLPADVAFENVSVAMAKLDVQGPATPAIVSALLGCDLSTLRYFRFTTMSWRGVDVIISRTGYTGERGFELYLPAGRIVELWETLRQTGVQPAGLGARDTLRLEAGLPLYGHELSQEVTPVEAGLERYAAKTEDFIGRAAVVQRLAQGPRERLRMFRIPGRQTARAGQAVQLNGAVIGRVTSGSFAPTLQCAIGFTYVAVAHAAPGTRLSVDTGRTLLEAELLPGPLYKNGGIVTHKQSR